MNRIPILICLICVVASAAWAADPPRTISYQGILVDSVGAVVPDGTYSMTFKFYDVSGGGTSLWDQTLPVDVAAGRFNAIIGEGSPISLSFDEQYWLGIAVDGDPEMSPRVELTGTPYSMYSHTVADSAVTGIKIKDGHVVRSINGLTDDVKVAGGANVTVTTSNDSIIVSSSAGGDADWTINSNDMFSSVSGNVGVGKSDPVAKFQIESSSGMGMIVDSLVFVNKPQNWVGIGRSTKWGAEYFGVGTPNTSSYGGMYIRTKGSGAWPFYGYSNEGGGSVWHYYDGTADKWHLNMSGNRLTVQQSNGYVGIGTETPSARLDVNGTMDVSSAATLSSTLDVGSTLDVTGATTLDNSLTVGGAATLNSTLGVSSSADVGTSLQVGTTLTVGSNSTFGGTLTIPTTTRYLTFTGNTFVSENETVDHHKSSAGYIYAGPGSPGSRYFYAPVNLPHNATITEFRVYIYDISATYGATVYLYRSQLSSGATTLMATTSTSAGETAGLYSKADGTVSSNVVNNGSYSYFIRAILNGTASSQLRVYNVRIAYTITSPLP